MGLTPYDILSVQPVGVVPVLVGPLQALLAILPGLLLALGGAILALFKPSTVKKLALLLWSQKIAVIVVAALVAAGIWGIPKLLPKPPVAPRVAGADWPLWRGGVARRGCTLDGDDPSRKTLHWRFTDGSIKTFFASPAVVGNRVYITSVEAVYDEGAIYGIDTASGEIVWRCQPKGYRATFSSPSVSGKYLVVGEGLHFTRDARVFCIDVEASDKQRKGVVLWSFRTGSHVESTPCIAEDRVVIGAGDDGMYCFALEPDEDGNARVLWHLEGERYLDCESSPVIHEGRVYFNLGMAGEAVCCVSLEDGKEIWRHETGYPVFGGPTIVGDKVFVGMGPGNYVDTAEEAAHKRRAEGKPVKHDKPFGAVACLDRASGKPLWRYDVKRVVLGAVAAADGRLYFGSRDNKLYCITTDGKPVGTYDTHEPIVSAPAVGKDLVYVASNGGHLHALKRSSLKPLWEMDLREAPASQPTMSSPAVVGGRVYIGTSSNGLVCAGEPADTRMPPWAGALGGPGRSGWIESIELGRRGAYRWRLWDADSGGETVAITAPPAHLLGSLYVGVNSKTRNGLAKVQVTGTASRKPETRWFVPTKNAVVLSAAVCAEPPEAVGRRGGDAARAEAVYVVDGRKGDSGRALRCLDPETGAVLWSRKVAEAASGEFTITDDELRIVDRADAFTCLKLTPGAPKEVSEKRAWPVGPVVGLPIFVDDLVVVALADGPALAAYDRPTGTLLWRKTLNAPVLSGPVLAGGHVWIGTESGLTPCDLTSGGLPMAVDETGAPTEPMKPVACGRVTTPLVTDDALIACISDAGKLLLVDVKTGETVRTIARAGKGVPPVLAGAQMLYYDGTAIKRCTIAEKKKRAASWFKDLDDLFEAKLTSPMIVVDGTVYAGTDTQGLFCIGPPKKK